ncbi:MAG: cytochrome c biogenesis protein ResB [Proteobacteria bacterium]|nr:cytochrome c biogenesis protein ResB [Pseudomonadota bacterium]
MKKNTNEVWAFFSSVKLALFTFFTLAITSIIGTIIPQGKEYEFYVQAFGAGTAKLFQVLNVPDMYNAWWFISLLVLFSINLMVCTIDRFPIIWRLVVMDNLALGIDRIIKMPQRHTLYSGKSVAEVEKLAIGIMAAGGRKVTQGSNEGGSLLFAQKGAWTRLGVIGVHVSILVIFLGAIIGSTWGYKGSVMITETKSTNQVYAYDGKSTPIPMDFEVRCDRFELSLYDNGAPKEYRSNLTVLKDGQEVLQKSIVVNDPLQYGGLTFYQSSYQAYDNTYVIEIENNKTKEMNKFIVAAGKEVKWPEQGLEFGIVNQRGPFMGGIYEYKIWFSDGKGEPSKFWILDGRKAQVERADAEYTFSLRQLYATGLQVTKDPGVWYVYGGCTLMLLGLLVAFFLSHQRIWVYIKEEDSRTKIVLSGTSNKNKVGFENEFAGLVDQFEQNESLNLIKESS